jgi:hypothetical protein
MHVASSFEFAMAAAMSENPRERLRGMAPAMLVWGRTKNWIGEARELGRACTTCDQVCRAAPITLFASTAPRRRARPISVMLRANLGFTPHFPGPTIPWSVLNKAGVVTANVRIKFPKM